MIETEPDAAYAGIAGTYAVFGTLLTAEHVAEALLFDTQAWRHLARTMFDALDRVF
ncbi:MAG: hypothetical protein ACO1O3_10875 [Sphingobium sp.]